MTLLLRSSTHAMRRRRLAVCLGRMLVRLGRVFMRRVMIVFAVVFGGRPVRLGCGLVMLGGLRVMCLSHSVLQRSRLSDRRGRGFFAACCSRRIPCRDKHAGAGERVNSSSRGAYAEGALVAAV